MSFTHRLALLLLGFTFIHMVDGKFSHCHFYWEMQKARSECRTQLQQQNSTAACRGEWDNVSCWRSANISDVLTLPCPKPFLLLFGKNGNLSRKCTESGWSSVYPNPTIACMSTVESPDPDKKLDFYKVVQILSCLGHSLSIITLLTSTIIIFLFRRLHCMRNYIHLNLFVSFILRAVAVLVKDQLLFSYHEPADCSQRPALVGCKTSLVFFQYFVIANFFWLLVEGLYLHMLLLVLPTYSIRLSIYMLIGWGIPLVFIVAWIICRIYLEDTGCWEIDSNPIPNRLINWPIMASVIINFILFISIIRILVQKLRSSDVGGNDQCQYKRLAKSTLLLIPLFGVYYMVFFYLVEPDNENLTQVKIFFELGLGSFQGLIVAVLYCFLNSEVQSELRRTWKRLSLKRSEGQDGRLHSMNQNGTENLAEYKRNSRAQSILQTEITGL
ncbi:vasoactive intestinal polypeptide receptor 2-like [Archocentrus centrarchus]|uniref:vasoactive intestinal polypeptide receptor 2-like n=1 Tax=Archocentrus centrarchus TaxID=63155 RepID=UPI0011E9CB6F|nr:vasoactive intestinal polypeptide receptor 2-like [Archocentrus centrarchus]